MLVETAEKSFGSYISSASYSAVETVIPNYDYSSLVTVEKNGNGDVSMILTDSFKVDCFASEIARQTFNILDEKSRSGVEVPLGAFSGIRLAYGLGPKINMKLLSVSSVKCDLVSEFTSAGINQTRHTLLVNIYSEVSIVAGATSRIADDKITILAYDNLIVGKVPQAYFNTVSSGFAD
ncbi:MAG: sporulation protein YunB [Clostridia bacterium]|nr:sporulation protein YunB [Clostridia bacterium]